MTSPYKSAGRVGLTLPDSSSAEAVRHRVAAVARAVDSWGEARKWVGSDPYDGGNATRIVSPLRRSRWGRIVLTQLVKRCPLDLRRVLGIPAGLSSVTVANVAAAHALGGFLSDDIHAARLASSVDLLSTLRLDAYPEPSWGYHWDTQTRVMYYPRTEPNAIATAFAGLALLDAHDRLGDPNALELAAGAAEWFLRRVPRTRTAGGTFFGYVAGDVTPIHNANLLACALIARVGARIGRDDMAATAADGVAYTVAHQRPDGAWLYGETPSTNWVDGFHTGYVLDALRICQQSGVAGDVEDARRRGMDFYRRELFLSDGTPKYYERATYPIDAMSVAQGIQTFALSATEDASCLGQAIIIFEYAMRRMWRGDGRFLFQRRRLWVNPAAHMRWVQSPTLRALSHLCYALARGG